MVYKFIFFFCFITNSYSEVLKTDLMERAAKGLIPRVETQVFKDRVFSRLAEDGFKIHNNLYEYLLFNPFSFHEKIFFIKEPDPDTFLRIFLEDMESDKYHFSVRNIQDFRAKYTVIQNQGYFVDSFSIKELVEAELYFVLGGNRHLIYLGVRNRFSNLLSATLPIYSEMHGDVHFTLFDTDMEKFLTDNGVGKTKK